jgi:hypothetical protein
MKEVEKIKKDKLVDRPMGTKKRLDFIQQNVYENIKSGEKRFENLYAAINENFSMSTADRGFVDAVLVTAFDTTLELLFLDKNSSLFVDLQGVLERFCLNALSDILPIDMKNSRDVITQMLDKKTLKDFSSYLEILGVWDNKDVKFAERLTQIRNGIAHKNIELVSKYLNDGKQKNFLSIESITHKVDCIPYIINSLKLVVKVSHIITSPLLKNPRLQARYQRYSSAVGLLACLFCIPDLITMPKDLKDLYLIDFFMPLNLISTEELGIKLREYQTKVIEFHDKLNVDDKQAEKLHSELYILFNEIFDLMRAELKIDIDKDIFENKPKYITSEEIRKVKENQ